jgi:hypothetical protein
MWPFQMALHVSRGEDGIQRGEGLDLVRDKDHDKLRLTRKRDRTVEYSKPSGEGPDFYSSTL